MKNSKYKISVIAFLFLFFLFLPFINSLFFSSQKEGGIEVNKSIKADFLLSGKKSMLVFFGYVGCDDVCVPSLEKLKHLYNSKKFESLKDEIDVFFVNLTPTSQSFEPDMFAKYFDKSFKGVYLSKKEIQNLDKNFGVYFAKDLRDDTKLNHTDYLYHVQNSASGLTLKSIYFMHPLQTDKIVRDIIKIKDAR